MLPLALLLLSTAAAMWPSSWITAESCGRISKDLFPNCEEVDNQCFCGNVHYLRTVAECIITHSNQVTLDAGDGWDRFINTYCDIKNAVPAERDLFTLTGESNVTFSPVSDIHYLLGYRAMFNHLKQKDTSAIQGGVLVGYWLFIPLCAFLAKLWRDSARYLGGARASLSKQGKYMLAWQKYVFTPALFCNKHMQKLELWWFRFSLGTRFDTIIILVYVLVTVIFMLCPYTFMDLDPFYDSRWKQMMRYSSDRSGILATIQLPLMFLFATRNNLLIWLTGWSYARFNRYHRAVARVSYALLIVHAVTKHIFSASYGSSLVLYFYPLPYYRYGVAAMFLFAIMIFFGQLRSRLYELFLISHVLCAFTGVIMSIFHLRGIGYQQPLYICLGIWAGDVVLRLGRLLIFNFSIFLKPIVGSRKTTFSTMKVYHQELTRVSIRLPVKWRFYPGQYIYLHLSPWTFLTGGHPFSVVGENHQGDGLEVVFKARDGFTKRLKNKLHQMGCSSETAITMPIYVEGPYGVSAPVEDYGEAIVFAGGIGITGVLGYIERLSMHKEGSPFRRIVLVWTVPKRDDFKPFIRHIYQLQKVHPIEFQLYCRGMRKEKINLHLTEVLSTHPIPVEMQVAGTGGSFNGAVGGGYGAFGVHNSGFGSESTPRTGPYGSHDGSSSTSTLEYYYNLVNAQQKSDSISSLDDMSKSINDKNVDLASCIFSGRPNIPNLIKDFFAESHSSICVVSCGPPPMVDQVRSCVCEYMDDVNHGKVTYFEEAFEW